jgi:hypothetical protein
MTTRKKPLALPPLPSSVLTAHGPVAVLIVEDLRDPADATDKLFGYWDPFARVISIRAGLHPTAAWLTLFHERTHADLSEVGIKLAEETEEVICNALAAARLAELWASLA